MKKVNTILVLFLYAFVLLAPGVIWWNLSKDAFNGTIDVALFYGLFFPLLGLYALSFLWIEFTLGAWRTVLNKIFNPTKLLAFHVAEGIFTFLFAFLHPLFLFLLIKVSGGGYFQTLTSLSYPLKTYWLIGNAALLLLTVAAVAGIMRRNKFVVKYWKYLHYLNYLVLPFVLIHSWFIGSHVQGSAFEPIWYFFTASYIFSVTQSVTRRMGQPGKSATLSPQTATVMGNK